MAVSSKNIHVGWVQGSDGYVKHKTVDDANTYEVLNPGTQFIFVDGDRKVHYLTIDEVNNQYHEELLKNQEVESIVEDTSEENEVSFSEEAIRSSDKEEVSGDLKEFGVDIGEPDLFNSDIEAKNSDDLLGSSEEDQEDDDLEIPAFLRRQKN